MYTGPYLKISSYGYFIIPYEGSFVIVRFLWIGAILHFGVKNAV